MSLLGKRLSSLNAGGWCAVALLAFPAVAFAQEDLRTRLERVERELAEVRAAKNIDNEVGDVAITDSALTFGLARMDINELVEIPDLDAYRDLSSAVDLRFWGRAKFDVTIDNYQGPGFTDFSTWAAAEGPDEVNFNPRDTRFGFAGTSSWDDWTARGVFEIDFYGANAGNSLLPRMRLGYAELENENGFSVRAGQDWTPILPQNPGMVDFGIMNRGGNIWWRVPQVTVRYKTGEYEILGSVMKHRISNAQEQGEQMPAVGVRLSKAFNDGAGLLAVNGMWRTNSIGGVDYDSWLVGVDGNWKFTDSISAKGEAWMGQGIGREFIRYGLDHNFTTGSEIESWGGFLSVEVKASEKARVNAGFGVDDPGNTDVVGSGAPFQKNQVGFLNLKYLMSKHFGFGAEVMHFDTQAIGGANIDGQRVSLSWWYIF